MQRAHACDLLSTRSLAITMVVSMRWLVAVAGMSALASATNAATVTKCGASKGYSYYLEGPLVPPNHPCWTEDGISGGNLLLLQDGDKFDIVYSDVKGTRSVKADGFEVVNITQPGTGALLLIAINGSTGIVEHYFFRIDRAGTGTLVWGSIKGNGSMIQKSGLMAATCKAP